VCYEIARCGCNKEFEKMLHNVKSTAEAKDCAEVQGGDEGWGGGRGSQPMIPLSRAQIEGLQQLQNDLVLLIDAAGSINSKVEKWLAVRPALISPTEETILSVVAESSTLTLPVRNDLLTYETSIETDEEWNYAQLNSEALLRRYCAFIQVIPSRVSTSSNGTAQSA